MVNCMRFFSVLFMAMLIGCGGTQEREVKPVLDGTFVANVGSLVYTITMNGADKSFTYSDTGGITQRNYNGTFALMGSTIIFKSEDGNTSKHEIAGGTDGFTLTAVENLHPISFKFEPVGAGKVLKYFRQ